MLCPTLIDSPQGFCIVHSTIDSTAHSMHLASLEHCIQCMHMHNSDDKHPNWLENLSLEPQPERVSNRGRPYHKKNEKNRAVGHLSAHIG